MPGCAIESASGIHDALDKGLVYELALFTALSGCSVGMALAFARRRGPEPPADGINDRAGRLVGLQAVLTEPIAGGSGRLFVGDTLWRVEGPDLPAGSVVRITGHKGLVLTIQAADAPAARDEDATREELPGGGQSGSR